MKNIAIFILSGFFSMLTSYAQEHNSDTFSTSLGELKIQVVGHGSLLLQLDELVIHIDPYSKVGDYSKLPKADLILITHQHRDHLDTAAISLIIKPSTHIILAEICAESVNYYSEEIMNNFDKKSFQGIEIEAVPAYNLVHKRENGQPYHPKGEGNGYILTFGNKKVYVAGDTENIPEMESFEAIDIAFLPMNLPYTMTPEMTANAAKSIMPSILYPYHYGDTNTLLLTDLLKNKPNIEVRIR